LEEYLDKIDFNGQTFKTSYGRNTKYDKSKQLQFALIQEPYCYKNYSNVYNIPGLRELKLIAKPRQKF
jgi:hypothetical protein